MDIVAPAPLATGEALARVRALLAAIDHGARARLDADARLGLVDAVVAVGRQVDALRAVLVAEAEADRGRRRGPRGPGIATVLATSPQVTAREAAGWLYAGQDIVGRPTVRAAALAGEVSVAQARSIDRVMGELPATLTGSQRERAEALLLERAESLDARDLAGQTRWVLQQVAPEMNAVEDELTRLDAQRRQAWAARSLTFTPDGRGSILLRGQLPVQEGEAFQTLDAAYTLSNRRAHEQARDRHDDPGLRTRDQRTADGLILMVRTHGGLGRTGLGPAVRRPVVVATMSVDLLRHEREQAGRLAGGHNLTAGELRRLLCDGVILPVVLGSSSEPLDVGRRQRLVTPGIRRALEARDRGCAFPGCRTVPDQCEAHHIVPWWAGGVTSVENLVLLCPHHHGTVEPLRFWHDTGAPSRWQVRRGGDGHPEFLPPARPRPSPAPAPLRNQRTHAAVANARRPLTPAPPPDRGRSGRPG